MFTARNNLSSDELQDDATIESFLDGDEPSSFTDEFPADIETPEDEPKAEPKWDPDPLACRQRVEAVLFLSRSPITSRKLSQLAGLEDGTQARTLIKVLNEHYDQVGCAFQVKRVAGGFQLLTRPQFAKWIRRLEHIPQPERLSNPMMETLAVVAYRQPIIKAEIEAIRGVSCGEILRQLLEKGLVKIVGRSSELGRPFLYATSKDFLTLFGFNSLDELPRAERLSGTGLPQWATSEFSESASEHSPMSDVDNADDASDQEE